MWRLLTRPFARALICICLLFSLLESVTPQVLVDLTLDDDSPPPPPLLSPLHRSLPAAPARISMPATAAIRAPASRLTRFRRRSLDEGTDDDENGAAVAASTSRSSAAAASSRRSPTLSSSNGLSDADAADDGDISLAALSGEGRRGCEAEGDDDLDCIDLTGDDDFKAAAAPAPVRAPALAPRRSRKRANQYGRKEAERESDIDSLNSSHSDEGGDEERIGKRRRNVHAHRQRKRVTPEEEESESDADSSGAESTEFPERDPRVNARLYQCSFLPKLMSEEQKSAQQTRCALHCKSECVRPACQCV